MKYVTIHIQKSQTDFFILKLKIAQDRPLQDAKTKKKDEKMKNDYAFISNIVNGVLVWVGASSNHEIYGLKLPRELHQSTRSPLLTN